jgi:hypothetical protein
MSVVTAIWHHPGTPPDRQGAGDYPVAIIDFINAPAQTIGVTARAIVVDATGHLNVAPANELEIVDPAIRQAIAAVQVPKL